MRNYFLKLALLASVVIIFALFFVVFKMPFSSNLYGKEVVENIEIANVGSSHGLHGFNYGEANYNVFNFAINSQSLVYDYYIIDFYKDHFKQDALLLIPISYFSFWMDETTDIDFNNKMERYIYTLDKEHNRYETYTEYLIRKYFYVIYKSDNYIKTIFTKKSIVSNDNIEEMGRNRAYYHLTRIFAEGTKKAFDEESMKALHDLIELCIEHNITPILITTPFLDAYSRHFDSDVLNDMYGQIHKLQNEYDIFYIDYSKDERFLYTQEYFTDTDHLNEEGAKAFTSIVMEDLVSLNLLNP